MTALRRVLGLHPMLAGWLVALGLLTKLVVPAGYMVGHAGRSVTIEICTGFGARTMAMPGMAHHPAPKGDHGKAEMPCAFAGLTAPSLAGADPLLLADAALFIARTTFRVVAAPVAIGPPPHLRPPLRGPPTDMA